MNLLIALVASTLFGFGLAVSGMINPAKVIGFLDITGAWDPTLALVMGGAVLVSLPAFQLAIRSGKHPLLAPRFQLPTRTDIDKPLVVGALIFGIGWGLGGFCPGPAVAALASLQWPVVGFIVTLALGQWLADKVTHKPPSQSL